ncbi:unnamed protein product [Moneuplotes crassus]|uniref:Uncharacterized protein n=1 Tax=Euplotes crassus TaxID=5936 RepID=A0AAD1XUN5_EUPCR|nr:unnamed protein product [Moneuplotes crassus]
MNNLVKKSDACFPELDENYMNDLSVLSPDESGNRDAEEENALLGMSQMNGDRTHESTEIHESSQLDTDNLEVVNNLENLNIEGTEPGENSAGVSLQNSDFHEESKIWRATERKGEFSKHFFRDDKVTKASLRGLNYILKKFFISEIKKTGQKESKEMMNDS